jgi:hypothetical protein
MWIIFVLVEVVVLTAYGAVFFPSLVDGFDFSVVEEKPEFVYCHLMLIERGLEDIFGLPVMGKIKMLEFCNLGSECFPQLFSSESLTISSGNFEGKSKSKPSTQKSSRNSEASSDVCYFKGTKVQFYLFGFLGGCTGLVIATLLVTLFCSIRFKIGFWHLLYSLFTQRLN